MKSGPDELKDWMERRGINQREAADALGFSEMYVSHLLNGHRRPGLDNALIIEERAGIPVRAWARKKDSRLSKSEKVISLVVPSRAKSRG